MPTRDEVDRLSKRLSEIRNEVPVNDEFTQASANEVQPEQQQAQGQQEAGDFAPAPQFNMNPPDQMREGVDGPSHINQLQQTNEAAQADAEQVRKDHQAQQEDTNPEVGQDEQDHGNMDHEPDID